MNDFNINNEKTLAIICYITFIGTIIAFILNHEKKNSFASFHIRQMLGLISLHFLSYILSTYVSGVLGLITFLFAIVLWFVGFIGAIQGEEKSVPILGDQFQEWFKSIG